MENEKQDDTGGRSKDEDLVVFLDMLEKDLGGRSFLSTTRTCQLTHAKNSVCFGVVRGGHL